MNQGKQIVDILEKEKKLSLEMLRELLETEDADTREYLRERAEAVRLSVYGNAVYIRGLIEFTNYCKNDCHYCGIRRSNRHVERYRLCKEEILDCCKAGYELGFRTYVLQGGEDMYYTPERLCDIIRSIKSKYPDCAITMSVGEQPAEFYRQMYTAGADRYLLRHETADEVHYGKLHPKKMSFSNRMKCLQSLKEIGYQVGCGFMVGSPYQTVETLYQDLEFIRSFMPHMVGIGPFIPHKETPYADREAWCWCACWCLFP